MMEKLPIRLCIDITADLTSEQLEYIFDCWMTFITQDLGLEPNQAMMYESEYEVI